MNSALIWGLMIGTTIGTAICVYLTVFVIRVPLDLVRLRIERAKREGILK